MGLPSYELVTEDSETLELFYQSGSGDSFLPERSWRGLEARAIETGARQSELEFFIERFRRLIDSTSDLLPSGTLTTPIPVADIKDLRISCTSPRTHERSWWRRGPERSISGSKRGIREMGISFLQCIDGLCRSQLSPRPSKKFRPNLGHNKWPIESGCDLHSKNPTAEDDCENPTDASNSCGKTLCLVRGSSEKEQTTSEETRIETVITKKATPTGWESLPDDLRENIILQRVDFRALFRFKILSKACKNHVESDDFRRRRGAISEGSFTAISYYIKNGAWQCSGFDLHSKSWRSLPTFSCLPPPDTELFKEFSVTGHGELMCAEVSKLPKKGELVVFNPLTGKSKALPPLLYPRSPVLVHISVNSADRSYKVIVAGSSTAGDEHLSRKMEVFDSSTSVQWKETCDLPGPAFGLNEHQAGVCLDGTLFFISFLEGDGGRGVVAFDVEKGEWLKDMTCPIPFSSYSNTLQLVENDGKVYLFSEQERGTSVEHCIDELEFRNPKAGAMGCQWRKVVQVKKSGGRGLLVYPEYTCVGFGEGKLCIFNALSRVGAVYGMRDGRQCEVLEPPPPNQKGDNFFTLNPASFTLQPSFGNFHMSSGD